MAKILLSQLSENLIASEIVRLGSAIKQKIQSGATIYNYTIGDFDSAEFPIPTEMQEAIIAAYRDGYTTYPSAEGEADLREAVSEFLQKQGGIDYKPSEILIAAGGRPLIYAAYQCIVDQGDKVIYPVPSWNNNHYVNFSKGNHVVIESTEENNFLPTAEQIRPHIKGASMLALCSPLNPTGTSFKKEELEKICDLILEENATRKPGEKKLYLLFDQIYWTLTFGDVVHYNPVALRPEMKAYTVFIDGISKAFAATGVRVGWSMAPEEVIVKMRSLNSHIGSWAPMAEQKAVAKYLKNNDAVNQFLSNFKTNVLLRLQKFYEAFQQLKSEGLHVDAIKPEAAIYLTVKIDLIGKKTAAGVELKDQEAVTEYLLTDAKIALVPFICFGIEKSSPWYRLSVGTCKLEDIDVVMGYLKNAVQQLT